MLKNGGMGNGSVSQNNALLTTFFLPVFTTQMRFSALWPTVRIWMACSPITVNIYCLKTSSDY
jgi:hypothetical protein